MLFPPLTEPYTVGYSQSSLIHLVGPSDCTMHGFVHGGKFPVCVHRGFDVLFWCHTVALPDVPSFARKSWVNPLRRCLLMLVSFINLYILLPVSAEIAKQFLGISCHVTFSLTTPRPICQVLPTLPHTPLFCWSCIGGFLGRSCMFVMHECCRGLLHLFGN